MYVISYWSSIASLVLSCRVSAFVCQKPLFSAPQPYSGENFECFLWIGLIACLTSPPTQHRLYGRWFLQAERPNQQYHSTEGKATFSTPQYSGEKFRGVPFGVDPWCWDLQREESIVEIIVIVSCTVSEMRRMDGWLGFTGKLHAEKHGIHLPEPSSPQV